MSISHFTQERNNTTQVIIQTAWCHRWFKHPPQKKQVYCSCLTNSERCCCRIQPSFSCVTSSSSWPTTLWRQNLCPYDLWRTNRWALTRIKSRGSSGHLLWKTVYIVCGCYTAVYISHPYQMHWVKGHQLTMRALPIDSLVIRRSWHLKVFGHIL